MRRSLKLFIKQKKACVNNGLELVCTHCKEMIYLPNAKINGRFTFDCGECGSGFFYEQLNSKEGMAHHGDPENLLALVVQSA